MTLPSMGVRTSIPPPSVRSGSRPMWEKSSAARIMRSILPGTGANANAVPGAGAGVVRRSSGDRPLLPSRDGGHLQRHRPPRPMVGDRAAGHRGVVRARRRARRRTRRGPGRWRRSSTTPSSPPARSGSGSRTTTWPPSSTSSRRPSPTPARPSRQVDPLRPHVVRRRGHRLVLDAPRRRGAAARRVRRAGRHAQGDGAAPPRHGHDRAHPRHPRRADDVRRRRWPCGACRPTATGPACARPGRPWRSASCPARSGRTPTSTPSVERHVCAALGLTPVPATQVIARDRHAEYLWACASVGRDDRADRRRAAPPAAHRGAGGRGGLRGRPEGLLGHAPQAQPHHRRAPGRPGPHPAGQPASPGWRTSRSGTSGTSPTRRSSG